MIVAAPQLYPRWTPQPPVPQFNVTVKQAEAFIKFADLNDDGTTTKTELSDANKLLDDFLDSLPNSGYSLSRSLIRQLNEVSDVLEGTFNRFDEVDLDGNGIQYKTGGYPEWINNAPAWVQNILKRYFPSNESEIAVAAKNVAPSGQYQSEDLTLNDSQYNAPNFAIPKTALDTLIKAIDDAEVWPMSHLSITREKIEDFINRPRLAVIYSDNDNSSAARAWRKDRDAVAAGREMLKHWDFIAPHGSIADSTLYFYTQRNNPNLFEDEDFFQNAVDDGFWVNNAAE